jgi:hypothetical protein
VPGVYLSVELQDLRFEPAEQSTQGFETRPRHLGDTLIPMIGHGIEQILDAVAANRSDNAELRQMRGSC